MGNSLPMARSKGTKQSRRTKDMLLASGRTRVSSRTSSSRNKRKKTARPDKDPEVRAAEDTTTESQVRAEAEIPDGDTTRRPKSKGHRRYDKSGKPNRGVEGKDTTPRRSANELGIEWITAFCPDGQPHYLIANHTFDGGSLFKCYNCHKHIWLPTLIRDATELEALIKYIGTQRGYCKFLDKHQAAKVMVAKLQDLWYARRQMTNKDEFRELVISVMNEKEYDKKEVTDGL